MNLFENTKYIIDSVEQPQLSGNSILTPVSNTMTDP